MTVKLQSVSLKRILNKWPGKQYFGIYRFLPLFFILGAALEFSMINWQVGETNFCFWILECNWTPEGDGQLLQKPSS